MARIPHNIEEITTDWLTESLGSVTQGLVVEAAELELMNGLSSGLVAHCFNIISPVSVKAVSRRRLSIPPGPPTVHRFPGAY